MKCKNTINKLLYEMQAELCSALASPVRLQILDLVANGEKTVGDLQRELEIPKANLSQHLAVLKSASILGARKEGVYQYIYLNMPNIKDACGIVRSLLHDKILKIEKENGHLIREIKSLK